MAPTLQDFNRKDTTQQMRMNAFQPRSQPSPAANPETINTIASYGAALDIDGQIDSVYRSISNQLSYSTSSPTLDSILGKWKQNDIQGSMDALRSVLIDPELSDEQKTTILEGFQSGQLDNRLSYNISLAASMADDSGENGEQEDIRIQLANSLDDVDRYNAWVQKNLNALNSENNSNWTSHVQNFITSVIPFSDAADQVFFEGLTKVDESGNPINTVQTLLLLGEGRERLRKTFMNIPLEQRYGVVQNIIKAIRSTSGSMANDAITLRQIYNLEQMVVPGAYGDTDRWVDNIFSVLDDTIILSPFTRAIRGLRTAVSAADETRVAQEIIARGERAGKPDTPPLMIEYKPALPDFTTDIDDIIDGLPIEPTSSQVNDLRSLIVRQMDNPSGFDIDTVINDANLTDQLNSTQINQIRQQLGAIRDKRTAFLRPQPSQPPTIAEVRGRHVSSNVQPTSISQIYKNTNVSKARLAHSAILTDETDNTARIISGTTRQNALAHDYLPEIGGTGRVSNKVEYDESSAIPDASIIKHAKDSEGASWADAAEKGEVQKRVINDWTNTIGLKNRSAMASIENLGIETTDTGVRLNQVYGPENGGFSNAFTAIDIVRSALRKYGVKDDEITILSRQADGNYAPVTGGTNLQNGDFLVQVNYDYRFNPKDVGYQGFDVSPLWGFLRIPDIRFLNKEGGITQHAVPKSVNIDPRAYVPGVAAADRAAGLQRQFLARGKEFANRWGKLPKEQQDKVDDYIRLANEQELPFNIANIKARGISDDGVEVLARWKQLQDTIGYLENADVARTLHDRGFEIFEHRAGGTRLIVEPVARTTVPNGVEAYDAVTDTFVVLSRKNIDEIYDKGGTIVKPRKEEQINGRDVQYILSPNTGDAFSRAIRDDDRILGYRHGYYHVRYTDPYYVTRRDPKTNKVKVIARASSNRDARIETQRLNDTKDGYEYDWKRDSKEEAFDNHLDVAINTGRSAQRVRGQRLERVKGANDKTLSDAGMESPMDSLTRSISSISHRVAFRNVIDAEKRRWMSQFKHLTTHGQFPKRVEDIKSGDGANEARHAYRHLEQLQDGYGNMMDDLSKSFFNTISETAGAKGWGWVDKVAAKAAKISPSTAGRLTAFKLFLAANPVRQLPLQALPAIPIISSLNPLGWPKVIKNFGILGAHRAGVNPKVTNKVGRYGLKDDETADMLEAYELSGMSAAVNAHVFLADKVGRLADRNVAQRTLSLLDAPLRFTQDIGFNLGEQTLIDLVWLSEYDRLTRSLGRTKLSPTERDQLTGKIRALTGDMNKGGEMPYNSNSFSVIMQFLQTPHKIASGLILGHKGLTVSERLKLATGYTLTFGIPGVYVTDLFIDKIIPPDNPQARDIVKGGLTNLLLNKFLTDISGEETRVDFSQSLQPFTIEPMVEFVGNLFTLNVADFVGGTAAASLIADNGRINNFARAVVAPFVPGSYEGVDEYKQIGLTFLQMFSGLSNTMKAMYIMEHGKITTATGQTVDEDVSFMETLMKAGGFQTMDEVKYWAGNMAKWEIDGSIQKDIEGLVDDLFTKYTREEIDVAEFEQYQRIMAEASRVFQGNIAYMERVKDYYTFKMRQNPDALYHLMFRSGLYTSDEVVKVIQNSNFTQEQIETLMAMYNITGEL